MPYPEHLLPKENYLKITWRPELCNLYLLRSAPSSDLTDSETGLVRDIFITDGSREQLKDFSTNLLGVFTYDNAALEWVKGERKTYFTSEWEEGSTVDVPLETEFSVRENFGCFLYPIGILHHYPQPVSIARVAPHTEARCYVCHTPVKGNFWHFSVRWMLGQEDVEVALTKNERRDLLSLVKTFLRNQAILDLKDIEHPAIPESWYTKQSA